MGRNWVYRFILLFMVLFASQSAMAQLVGSFRITNFAGDSIQSGCSPLVTIFVDSSKINGNPVPYVSVATGGAYNSHTWSTNAPLSNPSNQYKPSFVFNTPGTYTVTLVVTNNGVTYQTITKQITVYPPPVVSFYADVVRGCNPLTVTLYNTSANTTNCTWSMGDGTVYTNQCTVTHTFNQIAGINANCFSITLIATNQYGCQSSLTKSGYICIEPRPKAGFTADFTALCDTPFTVNFIDTSTAVNGLSYFWRFRHAANNPSSTVQNPSYTYPAGSASYNVSLIVRDTVCNTYDTVIKPNYISTSDVSVDFTASLTEVCQGQGIQFTSNITGTYVSVLWEFGPAGATSTQLNPTYVYNTAGTWDVRLQVIAANGCVHDTIYPGLITVRPLPTAAFAMSPNPAVSCQAPFTVTFTDQSVGATTWKWLFRHPSQIYTTNQQNPSYTYDTPGTYSVSLTVTNQYGCTSTVVKNGSVQIAPTVVNFSVDSPSGCAPLNVIFTDASTSLPNNPIIGWTWNFGDPASGSSNTSTQRNPVHNYSAVGVYSACLTIVTQSGCVGTKCMDITVGNPPIASFNVSALTVCVDQPISFTNNSTGVINQTEWTFGYPGGQTSNATSPPPFAFDEPGTYTIRLSVGQNGCKDDTSIVVTVVPPQADFRFSVSCVNPGAVVFTDLSVGASSYHWDFGDNTLTNDTSNLPSPTYTYNRSGTFNVKLTVTNNVTGCTHVFDEDVTISLLQANFTANVYTGCAPLNVRFINSSTGSGLSYLWQFGDPASGAANGTTATNPQHIYNRPGLYTVRLIATDINLCSDTVIKVDTIRVTDAEARFTASPRAGCIPAASTLSPVFSFTDQSISYQGYPINSWQWDFGDGIGTSSIQNPTYQYNTSGIFTVTLTVTNTQGCRDTLAQSNYIVVRKPVADFTTAYNLFCSGQPVQFNNLSTGIAQGSGTTYHWDFGEPGNADTSNLRNPLYTYSDTGTFTVKLVVRDVALGCSDSIVKQQLIRIDVPDLSFVANDTFRYCPPHLVNFSNFANFDTVQVRKVRWDFGDGQGYSTLLNPSYIYNRAGLFTVCLWVEFMNGCKDSICYPNYINVGGAVGNITAIPDTGCSPLNVCFKANTDSSAANHIWFFGDNNPWQQGPDSICHLYTQAGLYKPAVLLIDTQVPSCQYVLTYDDTIIADTVLAGFYFMADTVCESEPIQFTDSSKTLAGKPIVAWEWDFGDGTTDTVQNPLHAFQISGLINVTLTAYSSYGCVGSITRQIYVRARPTAAFDASDTIGCEQLIVIFTDQSVPGDTNIVRWSWDFGVSSLNNDTSRLQNPPPYFYQDTGHYPVTLLVVDANGCRDTLLQDVNVYPNPNGLANPDTVSVCLNDTLQLLGDTSYATYDWTPGTWLSDSTIARPWVVPLDTIDYELITTDIHGCYTIDSIHVIVNPLPTLTVSPYPDTSICEGDTIQLTAVGNGIAFLWTPATGLDNPNSPTPLASPPQTTTYEIYTVDGNTCSRRDSVKVVVNRFFTDYMVERVCLGDRTDIVDVSTTSDLPVATWQWTFGDPNDPGAFSTVRNPNHTYQDSGRYTVTLVLTDIIGCTDTLQKIARVDHPAEPQAFADTIICFGDAIQLTAIGGDTVYWTPTIDIDNPNSFTPTVSPQVTTRYVANITYGVCPFDTASALVRVNPTPQLGVEPLFEILLGDSVTLRTQTGRYVSIQWQPPTYLSCTDCVSPIARPDTTITYTVTLTDSLGCTNTKQVTVAVEERCTEDQIFVGNGFTPNGDGVNDIAYARLHGLGKLLLYRIFDRWGNLVFETNDAFTGWDGKNSKGEQLNSGVYVYIVEAECFSGQKVTKTGNVTIIK